MLFGTAQFALFLAALLLMLGLLPRRQWNAALLTASLLFYMLWVPAYLPLLLADIGVSYALLCRIRAAPFGSRARRRWLVASIAFSLGLLLYFKYLAFLLGNALPVLDTLLGQVIQAEFALPEMLLPLGISFYTFQIISLAADTYSDPDAAAVGGDIRVESLARYALYISFFPQLIAGPILRGAELLPQLRQGADPTAARTREGLWLFASGIAKKILLADFLLSGLVDPVFDSAGATSRGHHWVALYAFAFQLYFDFSGYTDMARGTARLIGIELPENFREPYLSRSPLEFWQRWHITLSRWLSLYLFVPISRALLRRTPERGGRAAIAATTLLTMTLCGLWHGADWAFVLWGLLQGVLLVAWPSRLRHKRSDHVALRDLPELLVFFNLFCLTLVLFRSPDLHQALAFFERLLFENAAPGWPAFGSLALVLCAGLHLAERRFRQQAPALSRYLAERPWGPYAEAFVLGIIAALVVLAAGAGEEFIYFQF